MRYKPPSLQGKTTFHHDLKPFFDSRKIPILQPDIMRGGYTGLREVAAHAHRAGLTIAPHLFPELSTYLNAVIPNPSWLEYMGWHDHLWVDPVLPHQGLLTPPTRHGLQARALYTVSLQGLSVIPRAPIAALPLIWYATLA